MPKGQRKVAVIGAGITGIATAYYLQQVIKEKKLPIQVYLIERSHRLGGKIQTVRQDGFIIEKGPESFLTRKKSAARLAEHVGMGDKLVRSINGKTYVLINDKLHPIPSGAATGLPSKWKPFLLSNLFSISGKLRASADLILPRSKNRGDQSLGGFFKRRLGADVVENLIEPLVSGMYAGDIDQLSLLSTFPQYYEAEKRYRSLLLGMKKKAFTVPHENYEDKDSDDFLTLEEGLESLVEAIEKKLEPNSVIKGLKVDSIKKQLHKNDYIISLNNDEKLIVDSVVVTLPHYTLPTLFPEHPFFEPFRNVPATSVATVTMAFPEAAIKNKIDGIGFMVARSSDSTITSCTLTHKKWPHAVPKGKALLRCYVGRSGAETIVDLSDDEIEHIVLEDIKDTLGISTKPDFTIVSRWKNAMPQYTVGHSERLEELGRHIKSELPGIFIAGSSYFGTGIPDCIDQGEEAVKQVLDYLSKGE
jgi:oxygen-dependent protoporphyrinogen oxidase